MRFVKVQQITIETYNIYMKKKGEILKDTVVIIAFVQSVAHLRQVSVTVN